MPGVMTERSVPKLSSEPSSNFVREFLTLKFNSFLGVFQLDNSSDKKSQGELAKLYNMMPLKTDPEEAEVINKMFLEQLKGGNANLIPTEEFKNKAQQICNALKDLVTN